MKILVMATTPRPYNYKTKQHEPHGYEDELGLREYQSLEECICHLRERTGQCEYVVMLGKDDDLYGAKGKAEYLVEVYNDYRE